MVISQLLPKYQGYKLVITEVPIGYCQCAKMFKLVIIMHTDQLCEYGGTLPCYEHIKAGG